MSKSKMLKQELFKKIRIFHSVESPGAALRVQAPTSRAPSSTVPDLGAAVGGESQDLPPLLAVLQLHVLHLRVGHEARVASEVASVAFLTLRRRRWIKHTQCKMTLLHCPAPLMIKTETNQK